jgi:hypothetical protein
MPLGHSPSTALRSYVSNDTYIAVSQAQTAEKALGIDDCGDIQPMRDNDIQANCNYPETVVKPIEYQQKQFGKLHPHYESEASRIPFSVQEKHYLRYLVDSNKIGDRIPENISSICLRIIRNDDELIPHFHVRHILSTQRLRPGLQALGICK